MRIFCSFEDKVIIISNGIEDYVTFMKERIEERRCLDLRTFYIVVIYVDDMPGKYIPVNIHYSEIGYEPHIIVPVKYLVGKENI